MVPNEELVTGRRARGGRREARVDFLDWED